MKNSDPVPLREENESDEVSSKNVVETDKKKEKQCDKKKKKQRNLWPIKAMIITLF